MTERALKRQRPISDPLEISFREVDLEGMMYPHDDALVISLVIANFTTRRVLIDNGSSIDILFWDTLTKMSVDHGWLRPSLTPLKGFSSDMVQPIDAITLPVIA